MRRALILATLLTGCARFAASPADYAAYRKTRALHTREDRLVAAKRYLGEHPNGEFVEEVRQRFVVEELAFYDAQKRSIDGLDWYLVVLPDGPHATDARLRRGELEEQAKKLRDDALLARARSLEGRLAKAEASRKEALGLTTAWLTSIAHVTSWGRPTWELPYELLTLLRAYPESGTCRDDACARFVSIPFSIPVAGGGLEERAAVMDLGLTLRGGGVRTITLRGPELFSRLFEAKRGTPRDPDALVARAEAVSFAIELVSGALAAPLPDRCDQGITPPEVLRRACDGWSLRIVIGDTAAEDDLVEIAGPPR